VNLDFDARDALDRSIVGSIVGFNVGFIGTLQNELSLFYYIPSLVINTRRAVARTMVFIALIDLPVRVHKDDKVTAHFPFQQTV